MRTIVEDLKTLGCALVARYRGRRIADEARSGDLAVAVFSPPPVGWTAVDGITCYRMIRDDDPPVPPFEADTDIVIVRPIEE